MLKILLSWNGWIMHNIFGKNEDCKQTVRPLAALHHVDNESDIFFDNVFISFLIVLVKVKILKMYPYLS